MTPPIKYPQLHDRCVMAKLIDECGTSKAIAQKIGCKYTAVSTARQRLGMSNPNGAPPKYPQLHDPTALKQLMIECGTYTAVARKIGCDISTVCFAVQGLRRKKRNDKQLRGGEQ